VDKRILAPVETVTRVNGQVTAAELTEYEYVSFNGTSARVFLPWKRYYLPLSYPVGIVTQVDYDETGRFVYDPRYKLSQTIEYEPEYGRLQTITTPEGRTSLILYAKDPNGRKIDERIAEVSNATVREVFYEGFEYSAFRGIITTTGAKTGRKVYSGASLYVHLEEFFPGTYVLTYWKSTDSGQTWQKYTEEITVSPYDDIPSTTISNNGWIDEVRVLPADARIKTWTYLPGVGVSSETDHNGRTVYREYDAFGRLSKILNNERQVLETYEYHLKNE
jgi:YD repeat-containing protein